MIEWVVIEKEVFVSVRIVIMGEEVILLFR